MSEETIFSKIIRKEIPAEIVFEDDRVTAFRDINPQAPTHILIIPNRQIPTIDDVETGDEELIGHMVYVAKLIARQEKIAKSGYRLIINCREDGGQEVYHIHLHLLGGKKLKQMLS